MGLFIQINKTKQANGPKQSLFGLTTPIHIQIKTIRKEEEKKQKEKEKKKKRKEEEKNSITLQFNRHGIILQKRPNKKNSLNSLSERRVSKEQLYL